MCNLLIFLIVTIGIAVGRDKDDPDTPRPDSAFSPPFKERLFNGNESTIKKPQPGAQSLFEPTNTSLKYNLSQPQQFNKDKTLIPPPLIRGNSIYGEGEEEPPLLITPLTPQVSRLLTRPGINKNNEFKQKIEEYGPYFRNFKPF